MRDSSTASRYIKAPVIVREAVNERLCNATLPNGKVILAHLPRGKTATFEPGTPFNVRLSLCDFSHGEIVMEEAPEH